MRKGFTLIELIVVIAIIAILAAIIAPNAFKAIEKASRSATIADWRTMKTASMSFYADTGTWPANTCEEALLQDRFNSSEAGCIAVGTGGISGWDGPYIETWPAHTRWGGIYSYIRNDNISWNISDCTPTNAGGTNGRYIGQNGTPTAVREDLDEQVDGTNSTACAGPENCGQHRWDTNNSFMLISADGTVLN